jgi:hypothetical protein
VRPPNAHAVSSVTTSKVSSAVFDFNIGNLSGSLKLQGLNKALQGAQLVDWPFPLKI